MFKDAKYKNFNGNLKSTLVYTTILTFGTSVIVPNAVTIAVTGAVISTVRPRTF